MYHQDLAYIHHVGFGDLASQAAPGILAAFKRAGLQGGLVVDLGCGSGLWARSLLQAGFAVLGVDQSPAMLALARTVAPGADLVLGSLHEVLIPPCCAVTALGEAIGYLADAGQRLSLGALFARVADALHPGGLLVLDLVVRGRRPMQYRSWRAGPDWAVLVEVMEEAGGELLRRDITSFRQVGAGYRRVEETHWVQLFDREEVVAELRRAGFSVRTSRRYGDYVLGPRRVAFQARTPR